MRTRWERLVRALRRAWLTRAPQSFSRRCTPDDAELGLLGEQFAARELERAGWRVLARRQRTAALELDLVAREAGVWVLIEVKSGRELALPRPRGRELPAARWQPGQRLDARRRRRLAAAARRLERSVGAPVRVDLCEVLRSERDGRLRLVHQRDLGRSRG